MERSELEKFALSLIFSGFLTGACMLLMAVLLNSGGDIVGGHVVGVFGAALMFFSISLLMTT